MYSQPVYVYVCVSRPQRIEFDGAGARVWTEEALRLPLGLLGDGPAHLHHR